jgi:small GTP-binding protein
MRFAIVNNQTELRLNSLNETEKLTSTDLAELMPEILKFKNLQRLDLSDNNISDIKAISELKDLQVLNLTENQINEISKEISKLKNLRRLYLFGNKISKIPKEIGELKNLVELDFAANQINTLPEEIGEWKNLKVLYLFDNQISDITALLELKNLEFLDLRGNIGLLEKIPEEILNDYNNPQKILNYYRNVTKGATRPLNEAKIVVIGEADVGKTCLINKLVYDKIEETDSTHGIRIHRWENDVRVNNEDIQLNVWDFGGQEIMHSTHQFFFTRRTIYILVIDARKNEDAEKTEEWLKRIQSFGGDSPVIIVGNQIDQNKRNETQRGVGYFSINSRGLQDKYKNIKGVYGLCAYDKKVTDEEEKKKYAEKFAEFRKDLIAEIGNLQGIATPFPSDWFAVKEDLETMHETDVHYISKSDYITKCIDRNVREQIDQTTIVEFLNEVGTVIYFEDLPDTMVFNPEWITKGVYAIVDNPFIKENKGILKREYLTTLLDPKDYPADKHDYILNMMKKFELCVDIEPNQTFLLPDLLPTSQPESIREDDWKETLGFQYHYDTYLPNIFTRFIVKMYGYRHGDLYWRNGIILEQGQSKALVKADVVAKKIFISVKGRNKRENQALLSIIRKELREIHSKFEVLNIAKKVPHPSYPEILKDYDELAAMEEDGETEDYVVELRRKLPISDWLDGVESAADRRSKSERKSSNGDDFIKHSPHHVSLVETVKDSAALVNKKETLARLRNKLEVLESKKAICDSESEKAGNKTAKTFIALTTLIHIISFGVLIFLIFSYQDGWNNFEKWTFGIFVGLEILNLLFSTGFFIKTSREFSWTEFRNALAERKREKKYLSYEIDEKEIEKLKKDIEQTEKELVVK